MQTWSWKYASRLTLVAALAACQGGGAGTSDTSDTPGDEALPEYLSRVWGITVRLDDPDGDFIVDEDGAQIFADDGTITVEGLGEHAFSTMTIVDPAALGGQVSFFVSNLDLSEERYFLYDPVENYVTIGDLTRGVAVSKNPDDTYDVWAFDGDAMDQFLTVADGYEALKVVEQYNEFRTISPYLLLMAFSAAHGATPEARSPQSCTKDTAASPPVCEIFKEFCDCAACLVLDRQGACDLCPEL
ncbi:MAG: hypothetical protein JNL82_34920 [Myxococcales bacterium]|nr:hypothetical protein [Myxococcales bacterium]